MRFYRKQQAGKLSSRVMDDTFVIQQFIQDELPTLLQALFLFLGLIAVIYAVNWQLALASTIVLPLHLVVLQGFKRPIKQASGSAQEQLAIVRGNLIEQVLGMEVVKGFTAEIRESQAFQKAIEISRRSQLRSKTYHVFQKVSADLLVGLGTVFLLGFGAYQVMGPTAMEVGVFAAFLTLVLKLYPTVLELLSGLAKLTRTTASLERLEEMLQVQETEAQSTLTPVEPLRGEILFDSVTFSYEEEKPILHDISLYVPPGRVCGILGPSGAGKTALISLVPRFFEPTQGDIYLDRTNLDEYDIRRLRESIGVVFQEPFLFNSSIVENLRYAAPHVSMSRIMEVARLMGAHDFIRKLPKGYDTRLGEEGVTLSRGQKQRLTLTRALLKNPRLLILDEATSSLDRESEASVVSEILRFMDGRTVLMVTHSRELLMQTDMVIQVSDGHIN
ncbi:MAG: ABC transporter ATP-binding protein/permease, partial [Rhodospirillales bacterium]|nr:ABC transporter ATP-binding protein/permease [Rhodospirillales bacterium]